MNPLSQAVVSGLMSGAVYALLASGLVLAFHTSRVVNLAHGEAYAVAGLVAAMLAGHGFPLWVALVAALIAAALFLMAVERFLLRPRQHWPVGSLILVTLAVAFLMRGLLQVAAGVDPLSFQRMFVGRPLRIAGGIIPLQGIALVLIGLAATVAVLVLLRSPLGWRLRAASENSDMASLLGIDTGRIRMLAFGIAGALGGLGAVLLVPLVSVDYQSGLGMTMRGFIAAAIAGMSPPLAIVAGLGLGLAEALVTTYFGALAQDPIVFLALIAVAVWQSRKILFGGSVRA
jgi:branched-subunit amino acid ABC-type transport system permease component